MSTSELRYKEEKKYYLTGQEGKIIKKHMYTERDPSHGSCLRKIEGTMSCKSP